MSNYSLIGMSSVDQFVVYLQAIEDAWLRQTINNSYCVTPIDLCVISHADYS